MGKSRMRAVTVVAATWLVLAAVPAMAVPIGNPLVARAAPSDGVTNVLSVYTDSPVPSDGMIDQALIYKQHSSDRAFRVFILRPTGNPDDFDVVASTAPITNTGATGQVHAYACSLPVQAGDLFAHTGYGIPYTQLTPPAGEPLYYPAGTPVTGTTITLPSAAYPSYGSNRTYSLQLEHVAGASALGNDLVPRAAPTDGVSNILQVYSDSPVASAGFLRDARVYKQGDYDRDFEVYVLRPTTVAGQYAVAARSGPITTTGALGEVQTYSLPNGPMLVEPGDLFAHSGYGIPYDDNTGTQPLYYPYSAPAAGSRITPTAPYTHRDYSLQVAETPAILLGNSLIPRTYAADGSDKVFNVYWDSPVTGDGSLTQVHIFNEPGRSPAYTPFELFVLRPTGNPDEYACVGRSGALDPGTTLGGQVTFDLDQWIAVQPGDLFAHYGRGMPYDQDGDATEALFHPVAVSDLPLEGQTVTLDSAHGYPVYGHLRRYSLAVTYVPEPTTLALLALGGGLLARRRRKA